VTTVIDLFAGLGGFSTGAEMAGMTPVWAGNHWGLACHYHALNHPGTHVACQDLQQADWRNVPAHDILLASPACQGHSKARGVEKPHHDALRSTAWAVIAAMEYHRPKAAVVENVPEFADWSLFPSWKDAAQRLGYSVSPHVIDAADHGVPQHRERVFIVLTRSAAPITLRLPRRDHVAVNSVIEWDAHTWTPINKPGRAAATLARVASGRAKFGSRFVAPFYGSGSGATGRSIHRPIGTVTTLDRWALINGDLMRVLQPSENRAIMGFPSTTRLPPVKRDATFMLGNAVSPPVACDLLTALEAQL
jgi:DNA (cytosine-5)-methyltransferase 1